MGSSARKARKPESESASGEPKYNDPVCGMSVSPSPEKTVRHAGQDFILQPSIA